MAKRARVTKLVEVCVDAVGTWDGTHQPGFDEGAPFVDENSLATDVILATHGNTAAGKKKKKTTTTIYISKLQHSGSRF